MKIIIAILVIIVSFVFFFAVAPFLLIALIELSIHLYRLLTKKYQLKSIAKYLNYQLPKKLNSSEIVQQLWLELIKKGQTINQYWLEILRKGSPFIDDIVDYSRDEARLLKILSNNEPTEFQLIKNCKSLQIIIDRTYVVENWNRNTYHHFRRIRDVEEMAIEFEHFYRQLDYYK